MEVALATEPVDPLSQCTVLSRFAPPHDKLRIERKGDRVPQTPRSHVGHLRKWLLTQHDRGDGVDGIADAGRADRTFPMNGGPEAVRAHLRSGRTAHDGDCIGSSRMFSVDRIDNGRTPCHAEPEGLAETA